MMILPVGIAQIIARLLASGDQCSFSTHTRKLQVIFDFDKCYSTLDERINPLAKR
jgi:hypothetical protein